MGWLGGFEVDDKYWRPALAKARRDIIRVRALSRRLQNEHDDQFDVKAFAVSVLAGTSLAAPLGRLNPAILESVVGIAASVVTNRFHGFSTGEDEKTERTAIISTMGATRAGHDSIGGSKLNFAPLIEARLH